MPPDGSGAFSVWREREAATAVVKQLGAAANAVSKQRQATAPLQLPPHPDAPQSLPITIVGTGPYRLTFPANPVPGREFAEGRAECLPARVDEMLFAGAASAGWRVVEAKRGSAKKSQWLYLDPAGNSNTSKTTAIEKASAAAEASSSSAGPNELAAHGAPRGHLKLRSHRLRRSQRLRRSRHLRRSQRPPRTSRHRRHRRSLNASRAYDGRALRQSLKSER